MQPPQSGPRKQAKEYSPLETYLRHLLMDRLEPDSASVSFVTKQIFRFPWNDPSQMCGSLICKIMLKTCRKGRYKAIQALASVAANLRRQRPEISIRLIDAIVEELRWAMEHPNFRDQQRIISYTRLLGELFCVSLVSGQHIIQQLYLFVNFGHEIPQSLREASEQHQEAMAAGAATSEGSKESDQQLPVYNSSGGVVQAINEDEEMEEAGLDTKEEQDQQNQPVAVSRYSKYDPRVPTPVDPPNSAFRVKLVCTLLEVVAKNVVTRNTLAKLEGFLTAFQRYLFTKTMLPTEVEFSLLDTFDVIDSMWRKASKEQSGKGGRNKKEAGAGEVESGIKEDMGFTRYATWLEAHNATVAFEEADHLQEVKSRARVEALAGESTAEGMDMDGDLLQDDDSLGDDDDDDDSSAEDPLSVSAKDSVADDHHYGIDSGDEDEDGGDEHMEQSQYDESDEDSEDSNESEGESDEEGSDDDEFDEEAYRRQMEEEAFERELRRVTMEALEKGKVAARSTAGGKVADSMPSGSQIIKKKVPDTLNSPSIAPSVLGGGEGISFQLLKKGHKGKMEAKELIVPADTNLAKAATKQDDEAARERDMIKARVLQYEAESAEARQTGGNVYLEQEKLQVIRNRPLSMEDIDKNFGTTGGNLRPDQTDRPRSAQAAGGRGPSTSGGRTSQSAGRSGRGGGQGRGRGRTSGRTFV